jgi:hypothetical protein
MKKREVAMLSWSLAFFIIAIIAAVFGFGGSPPVRRKSRGCASSSSW